MLFSFSFSQGMRSDNIAVVHTISSNITVLPTIFHLIVSTTQHDCVVMLVNPWCIFKMRDGILWGISSFCSLVGAACQLFVLSCTVPYVISWYSSFCIHELDFLIVSYLYYEIMLFPHDILFQIEHISCSLLLLILLGCLFFFVRHVVRTFNRSFSEHILHMSHTYT